MQIVQTAPDQLRASPSADPDRIWTNLDAALHRLLDYHGLRHVTLWRDHEPPQATTGGKYRTVIPLQARRQFDLAQPEPPRRQSTRKESTS